MIVGELNRGREGSESDTPITKRIEVVWETIRGRKGSVLIL